MTLIDHTCNAVIKQGRVILICDKPLGHVISGDPDHQMGDATWRDDPGW